MKCKTSEIMRSFYDWSQTWLVPGWASMRTLFTQIGSVSLVGVLIMGPFVRRQVQNIHDCLFQWLKDSVLFRCMWTCEASNLGSQTPTRKYEVFHFLTHTGCTEISEQSTDQAYWATLMLRITKFTRWPAWVVASSIK